MTTGTPNPQQPAVALLQRPSADQMSAQQLGDLRRAISTMAVISDDRGYQYWAGIHGLPLQMFCTHNSPLFLAWHRAYLYFFERALRDQVANAALPWWDWSTDPAVPAAYSQPQDVNGPNPLYSAPIQPTGREPGGPDQTTRNPGAADAPPLPTHAQVKSIIALPSFTDFQTQVEDLHNAVHMWVAGTMGDIATAAYDPLFWAHHTMIDRLWRLWQLAHPAAAMPGALLNQALPPFNMTVSQTLDVTTLGYDYAASSASVQGTAA